MSEHDEFLQSDFGKKLVRTLENAMKMKARMKERGITKANVKCPECDGRLHMHLVGSKQHARFWCDGTCGQSMIE